MAEVQAVIERLGGTRRYQQRDPRRGPRRAVDQRLTGFDTGSLRWLRSVRGSGTNQWLKKAVLLYFRLNGMTAIPGGPAGRIGGTRCLRNLPAGAIISSRLRISRRSGIAGPAFGLYRAGVILMPSFVNLGAYVDSGTMVDSWTTVGSQAQIGKNCHLSGGVGIGGVLEPLQSDPVVIEDNCFIGARAEVAEGVLVGEGSVLAMGVYLSASTRIIERATGEIFYGRVPPFSVVVSGTLPGKPLPDGSPGPMLRCAVIVKRVDAKPEPRPDQRFAARLSDEPCSDPPGPDPLPVGDAGRGGALDHLERCSRLPGFARSGCRFPNPARPMSTISMPAMAATGRISALPGIRCRSSRPRSDWTHPPFAGVLADGQVWGRGRST